MKKYLIIGFIAITFIGSFFALQWYRSQGRLAEMGKLNTVTVERGSLNATVNATGAVRANQTAHLTWKTRGTVAQVDVQIGDQVASGQVLTTLDTASLPPHVLQAQADLISAQRALDDLLNSDLQRARAWKGVDEAQLALEEAQNPALAQATALQALAEAEQALEDAQQRLEILTKRPSQFSVDQAYANMLLAENKLDQIREIITRIENRMKRHVSTYQPWESKSLYRKILKRVQIQLTEDQINYEQAVSKYNQLLEPPNENDVAVAEAELTTAHAQLEEAQRAWQRTKDGSSPAEIALLEAQLEDAQREWRRLRDGPDPADIAVAEARIAAAQATLEQTHISAPFSGTITRVENQPGDQVSAGSPAFRLDDLSHLFVDLQISEVEINRIEIGQAVVLTFDAILAREYNGKVVQVATAGTELLGVVNFKVTVELMNPDETIKPGMTSSANIVISRHPDVLLVPNQAVRLEQGKHTIHILKNDGSLDKIEISLGATSDTHSEVLAGDLQVGDRIVLNPPAVLPTGPGSPGHP
jgi:HlyD family secretion protein